MRMNRLFAIPVVAICGFLPAKFASASDAGWEFCSLVYLKGGADPVCNYRTFEQCQAAISGLGGTCIQNPYFRVKKQPESSARSRR